MDNQWSNKNNVLSNETMINKLVITIFIWLIKFYLCAVGGSRKTIFDFYLSIGQHFSSDGRNRSLNLLYFRGNICYIYPKEKFRRFDVRWAGGGGLAIGPLRPIQLSGKMLYREFLELENECGGAPSCLKITHSWNNWNSIKLTHINLVS